MTDGSESFTRTETAVAGRNASTRRSVRAIAKKEVRQGVRSYPVLGASVLLFLSAVLFAAIQWVPELYPTQSPRSTLALINSLSQPGAVFIPLLGLFASFTTITGERERGSLKLLLGLPHSRRDIILGKFLGRTLVVVVAIGITSVAVGLVAFLSYAFFDLDRFLLNTALMQFQGMVYVAIGVGISALVGSQQRAVGVTAALLGLVFVMWDAFMAVLQWIFIGPLPPGSQLPDWLQFLGLVNPGNAFLFARRAVIPEYYEITVYPESTAYFLEDWVGFVLLFLWMLLPLGLGYQRFDRTDIHS